MRDVSGIGYSLTRNTEIAAGGCSSHLTHRLRRRRRKVPHARSWNLWKEL
jgi:hypothetical protein